MCRGKGGGREKKIRIRVRINTGKEARKEGRMESNEVVEKRAE